MKHVKLRTIVALALVFIMLFTFCGCNYVNRPDGAKNNSTDNNNRLAGLLVKDKIVEPAPQYAFHILLSKVPGWLWRAGIVPSPSNTRVIVSAVYVQLMFVSATEPCASALWSSSMQLLPIASAY